MSNKHYVYCNVLISYHQAPNKSCPPWMHDVSFSSNCAVDISQNNHNLYIYRDLSEYEAKLTYIHTFWFTYLQMKKVVCFDCRQVIKVHVTNDDDQEWRLQLLTGSFCTCHGIIVIIYDKLVAYRDSCSEFS